MNIASQYRATLKHPEVEEILDLVLFRPIAFPLVKVLVRLPVTPNQITVAAMLAGIASGYCCAIGSRSGFLWGAFLYGLCNLLDCSDGMVARMKGNGTRIGRIINMFVDVVANSSVFVGLGIGLTAAGTLLPYNVWLLVIAAVISYALHSYLFDKYRNEYLARGLGKIVSLKDEIAEMTAELRRLDSMPGTASQRMLIQLYLRFSHLQQGGEQTAVTTGASADTADRYRLAIRLWSLIGSTSHITVLIVALLLNAPMIFFWFVIVFANLWSLLVWIYQKYLDRMPTPRRIDMLDMTGAKSSLPDDGSVILNEAISFHQSSTVHHHV